MVREAFATGKRLLKLSFYVALGGASAIGAACGGTQSPAGDGGGDADGGAHDADRPTDGTADAATDGRADAAADTGADAAADADMWDVVYE